MAQSSTATCGQVTSKVQRGPPSVAAHPSWCSAHRAVTVLAGGTFPPVPGSHIPKEAPVCPPLSGEGFSPCPGAHGCQLSIQPSPVPVRPQELRVMSPSPLPGNRGNPEVKAEDSASQPWEAKASGCVCRQEQGRRVQPVSAQAAEPRCCRPHCPGSVRRPTAVLPAHPASAPVPARAVGCIRVLPLQQNPTAWGI